MTERDKLRREILALDQMIKTNAATLSSKTMTDDDREELQRQMTVRMAHRKLLQASLIVFRYELAQQAVRVTTCARPIRTFSNCGKGSRNGRKQQVIA